MLEQSAPPFASGVCGFGSLRFEIKFRGPRGLVQWTRRYLESQVAGNKQLLAKVPLPMLTQTGMMSFKLRLLQPASANLSSRDKTLGSDMASSLETLDIRRHKH